jgi:16S rRNA (uracil1498-N3)-methyltransferase
VTDPVFHVPDLAAQLATHTDGAAGAVFTLPAAETKHLAVKRIRDGESVVLTDGRGLGVAGVRTGETGGTVTGRRVLPYTPAQPTVTVVQAIPKGERAELAVDLAVQAGADRIIPWQADRCVARWDGKPGKADKARGRWEATAVTAMKQARRLSGARVDELLTDIADLPGRLDPAHRHRLLVLHEIAAQPLADTDLDADELVLVIGPEGGVTDREIAAVTAAGGTAVVLGPEVYRSAAAAAVALGALGVLTPRWSRDHR